MRRFLVLMSIGFLGCSGATDEADRVEVYPVTGKITLAKRPVAGASVTFAPLGEQPTAFATADENGEFSLTTYDADDGAAAGEYAIVVMKASAPADDEGEGEHSADPNATFGASHAADGAAEEGSGSLVPAKFGTINETPLKRTVSADGENRFEIELLE